MKSSTPKYTVSYAQNREDIIIDAFFEGKKKGVYIDVGANDPIINSVTNFFALKGWTGVNIEPNPALARRLVVARPGDYVIAKGVSNITSTATLRIYEHDGLSTFSDAIKNEKGSVYDSFKQKYKDVSIEVDTLKNILGSTENLGKIDFMKIDVEGMEYEVLEGNDWNKYHPELLCIEADHVQKDWRGILEKAGYVKFFEDGLNEYYADKSSVQMKKFSFSESVLMRYPTITPFVPHSEKVLVAKETFAASTGTANQEEKPSIALQLKWTIATFRNIINEGTTERIITLKREHLKKKVQKSFEKGNGGKVGFISYATPRITLLRAILAGFNVLVKIAFKLRIRRSAS